MSAPHPVAGPSAEPSRRPRPISRPVQALAVAVATLALAVSVQYLVILPMVESRICDQVVETLEGMDYHNLTVTCSGRDVSLAGPVRGDDAAKLTKRINNISGVRTVREIKITTPVATP